MGWDLRCASSSVSSKRNAGYGGARNDVLDVGGEDVWKLLGRRL